MKIHRLMAIMAALAAPLLSAQTQSLVPNEMSYQGFLTDGNGDPVGAGSAAEETINFRLYKTATGEVEEAIWGEQHTVSVVNGSFAVILGNGIRIPNSVLPTTADLLVNQIQTSDDDEFYIGIQLGDGSEFTPRQKLLSGAFAYRAKVAEVAESIDAGDAAGFAAGTLTLGANTTLVEGGGGRLVQTGSGFQWNSAGTEGTTLLTLDSSTNGGGMSLTEGNLVLSKGSIRMGETDSNKTWIQSDSGDNKISEDSGVITVKALDSISLRTGAGDGTEALKVKANPDGDNGVLDMGGTDKSWISSNGGTNRIYETLNNLKINTGNNIEIVTKDHETADLDVFTGGQIIMSGTLNLKGLRGRDPKIKAKDSGREIVLEADDGVRVVNKLETRTGDSHVRFYQGANDVSLQFMKKKGAVVVEGEQTQPARQHRWMVKPHPSGPLKFFYKEIGYDAGNDDEDFGVACLTIDPNGTPTTVSDRNLKRDITGLGDGLKAVMALAPKSYQFKSEPTDSTERSFGFIAQQVKEVIPDIVSRNDEFYSLSYTEIIPFAVAAIQEQQDQIKELEAQIEGLKQERADFEQRLSAIETTLNPSTVSTGE